MEELTRRFRDDPARSHRIDTEAEAVSMYDEAESDPVDFRHERRECRPVIWKGMVAGVVGGLAASWVMNQFQAVVSRPASGGQSADQQESDDEDASQKVAQAIANPVLDRPLMKDEKKAAGAAVHYAFGSTVGAAYGVIAEMFPASATALGAPFGAAVWLGADEVAVPLLGLSRSPAEYPASTHGAALAAHLVYGISADLVRRAVRAAL